MHHCGQGTCTFLIPTSVMDKYREAGFASKYFDLYVIPEILNSPHVIFEGLLREEQAESLCYSGIPSKRHLSAEVTTPPPPEKTFVVYINKEMKIFEWRWEKADKAMTGYPIDWQTRYRKVLWKR